MIPIRMYFDFFTPTIYLHSLLDEGKFILLSSVERVSICEDIWGELFSYSILLFRKILSNIPITTQTNGPVMRFKTNVSGFRIEIVRMGITISWNCMSPSSPLNTHRFAGNTRNRPSAASIKRNVALLG